MKVQRPDRCSGRESHQSGESRVAGKKQQLLVVGWKAEGRVAYSVAAAACAGCRKQVESAGLLQRER